MLRVTLRTVALAAAVCLSSAVQAHFIFLGPVQTDAGRRVVPVFFGDDASPDNPAFLARLKGLKVLEVQPGKEPVSHELHVTEKDAYIEVSNEEDSMFLTSRDMGLFERGETVFRLQYYAKTGPVAGHENWTSIDSGRHLSLDVLPKLEGDKLVVTVQWNGKPVSGSQVTASGPELDGFSEDTNEQGQVSFPVKPLGVYSIRARHIDKTPGEYNGKAFPEVRHYSTAALKIPLASQLAGGPQIPDLPEAVTSFGGAITDDAVYIYGGHTGGAHSYSEKEQGRVLLRASLKGGDKWDVIAEGPGRQGLALVAHDGKLYRIGGFTAKNAEGEDHNLISQAEVARFDLAKKSWEDLPSLPEPRSSFDAAVLDNAIYVIGGWQLRGKENSVWHKTAWKLDLTQPNAQWEALPAPTFERRALAVAAFNGKLYAIGGMQSKGGPTTRVDILDPKTGEWSQGPSLVGEKGMTGFGSSAFATGGRLYCSTIDGDLQQLSEAGDKWEVVKKLPTARFFHRMLPVDDNSLLMVGGANMGIGKFVEVEIVDVQ